MKTWLTYLLLFVGASSCLSAQSFQWQHPYPVGTIYSSIHFVSEETGWIGGQAGSLIRTVDGGSNWQEIEIDPSATSTVSSLFFIDAQTGWVGLVDGRIFHTNDGGNTWDTQYVPDPYGVQRPHAMYFSDHLHGWVGGFTSTLTAFRPVLRTVDGGQAWTTSLVESIHTYRDAYFLDSLTGWMVGDNGTIIKTTDGGINWMFQYAGTDTNFRSVSFVNPDTGWISGGSNIIYSTFDGGSTWSGYPLGNHHEISMVSFIDENYGWAAKGSSSPTLYRTTNGGLNWQSIPLSEGVAFMFTDSLSGWLVGANSISRTHDGGRTAYPVSHGRTHDLNGVSFTDANHGWAVGTNGTIMQTKDGGNNWEYIPDFSNAYYFDVFFIDTLEGWIHDSRDLKHTLDGGLTWTTQQLIWAPHYLSEVQFPARDTGYVSAGADKLFRTYDRGVNWIERIIPYGGMEKIWFFNGQEGLAGGSELANGNPTNNGSLFYTADGGDNWTDLSSILQPNQRVMDISFLNEMEGWVLQVKGAVRHTTDGGSTWTNQIIDPDILLTESIYSIVFADSLNGWASGSNAYFTNDGGNSWTKVRGLQVIRDFESVGPNHSWGVGARGSIVKLSSGESMSISGTIFHDRNANGIRDTEEIGIANQVVLLQPLNWYTTTNRLGGYRFNLFDTLSYTIQYLQPPPYQVIATPTAPDYHSFMVTDLDTTFSLFNFGLVDIPDIHDLESNIFATQPARPGFAVRYQILIKNVGTEPQPDPIVYLKMDDIYLDSAIVIDSVSVPYSYITGDTIVWELDTMVSRSEIVIDLYTTLMPDVDLLGDTMTHIVQVLPMLGDTTPDTNVDTLVQEVTGAYDPNDKLVNPSGEGAEGEIPIGIRQLTYTIRFQNTGTDTAFNVIVLDTLDGNVFDISSLEMLTASHDYDLKLSGEGILEWKFLNIELPDSNVNEPLSHGAIHFRIDLLEDLTVGTRIENRASIYFDFNPPIVTPSAVNTLVQLNTHISPARAESGQLKIYPNPTSERVTIEWLGQALMNSHRIELIDLSGRILYSKVMDPSGVVALNISGVENGLYFVRMLNRDRRSVATGKLMLIGK